MRKLIFAALLFAAPWAFGQGRISAGTGIEGRVQEEVNPDLYEARFLPQFFTQLRYRSFGLSLEGGFEERNTSSGSFQVDSRSYSLGLWGRYEFRRPLQWSPFAGAGLGTYLDEVRSSYGGETDVRDGRRGYVGFNGGISHAFWNHLLVEGEMRAVLVQDRKDVALSGILRVGFVL